MKLSDRVRPNVEAAPWVIEEIEKLQAERDALQATLDDYMDDHKAVVNEQCAGDEKHCTCVPHLRKRIKEVEAERDAAVKALRFLFDHGAYLTERVPDDLKAAIDAAKGDK